MNDDMEFYKINDVCNYQYYPVPKELSSVKFYRDILNSDSKLLYGLMIDRLKLSQKSNWYDEDGNVYIILTRKEAQEKLGISDKTVTNAFRLLVKAKLIKEKVQGLGKPNLIYVAKLRFQELYKTLNRNLYDSREEDNTFQDKKNLRRINTINTDNNFSNKRKAYKNYNQREYDSYEEFYDDL